MSLHELPEGLASAVLTPGAYVYVTYRGRLRRDELVDNTETSSAGRVIEAECIPKARYDLHFDHEP